MYLSVMDDERNTRRFFVRTSMFEGFKHKPKKRWTCYIIRGDDIVEKKNDAQLQTTFVTTLQVAAMCSG